MGNRVNTSKRPSKRQTRRPKRGSGNTISELMESPFQITIHKFMKIRGSYIEETPSSDVARLNQLADVQMDAEMNRFFGSGKKVPEFMTSDTLAYLVSISKRMDLTGNKSWSGLTIVAELGSGMPFGILNGPADIAALMNLRGLTDDVPAESWKAIDKFLQARAKKVLAKIKRMLGAKRGRPKSYRDSVIWSFGASLWEAGYSWQNITRRLDPEGYDADRKGAIDRMRLGIQRILKDRNIKSAPTKTNPQLPR